MTQTQPQIKQRLTVMIKNIRHGMITNNYPNKAQKYLMDTYDELQSLRKDMDD